MSSLTYKRKHPFASDTITDLTLQVERERLMIEQNLVGALVSDPRRGARLAKAAGVQIWRIHAEDLQTVACAVFALAIVGKLTGSIPDDHSRVAALTKIGLIERGDLWHGDEPGGVGTMGPQALAALFFHRSVEPQDAYLACWARRLVAIDQRQRTARTAHDQMILALQGREMKVAA